MIFGIFEKIGIDIKSLQIVLDTKNTSPSAPSSQGEKAYFIIDGGKKLTISAFLKSTLEKYEAKLDEEHGLAPYEKKLRTEKNILLTEVRSKKESELEKKSDYTTNKQLYEKKLKEELGDLNARLESELNRKFLDFQMKYKKFLMFLPDVPNALPNMLARYEFESLISQNPHARGIHLEKRFDTSASIPDSLKKLSSLSSEQMKDLYTLLKKQIVFRAQDLVTILSGKPELQERKQILKDLATRDDLFKELKNDNRLSLADLVDLLKNVKEKNKVPGLRSRGGIGAQGHDFLLSNLKQFSQKTSLTQKSLESIVDQFSKYPTPRNYDLVQTKLKELETELSNYSIANSKGLESLLTIKSYDREGKESIKGYKKEEYGEILTEINNVFNYRKEVQKLLSHKKTEIEEQRKSDASMQQKLQEKLDSGANGRKSEPIIHYPVSAATSGPAVSNRSERSQSEPTSTPPPIPPRPSNIDLKKLLELRKSYEDSKQKMDKPNKKLILSESRQRSQSENLLDKKPKPNSTPRRPPRPGK